MIWQDIALLSCVAGGVIGSLRVAYVSGKTAAYSEITSRLEKENEDLLQELRDRWAEMARRDREVK